jgi:hypothetical protein
VPCGMPSGSDQHERPRPPLGDDQWSITARWNVMRSNRRYAECALWRAAARGPFGKRARQPRALDQPCLGERPQFLCRIAEVTALCLTPPARCRVGAMSGVFRV